jgi:hypothetical protein
MSRQLFKSMLDNIVSKVQEKPVEEMKTLSQKLESLEQDLKLLTQEDQKTLVNTLYQLTMKDMSISQSLQDKIAFIHAKYNFMTAIIRDEKDTKELNLEMKMQKPKIKLYFDMSGSMDQLGVQDMTKSVINTLKSKKDFMVDVYTFGDYRHEQVKPYTLAEFEAKILNQHLKFDGGCTSFRPAWNVSLKDDMDSVCIIVSDGSFTDNSVPFHFHKSARAIIFYAPPWSPSNVTKTHAQVLATVIDQSAVYNGDILPGNIHMLNEVIDNTVGSSIIPDLPGRKRIGIMSIPNKLLLPKYMREMLEMCEHEKEAKNFLTKLNMMYEQLLSSAKQDIERCYFSDLFGDLMSLNPTIIKLCESMIVESVHQDLKPYYATLYKTVVSVKDYISSENSKLLIKYKYDANKLQVITSLMQKATTVSERQDIFDNQEKYKKLIIGYVKFPECIDIEALTNLFHRLRTIHSTSEVPGMDQLLVTLFKFVTITKDANQEEYMIPVWKNGDKIDILNVIRLFPGYLREQQDKKKKVIVPDFTFQPRTAKRIAFLLRVAEYQGTKFPNWLSEALKEVQIDKTLVTPNDDDNVSPFWMHILKQLSKMGVIDSNELTWIDQRLTASAIKWFVIKTIQDEQVKYTVPVYPNTMPFLDNMPNSAYIVYTKDFNFVKFATGEPYSRVTVLIDPKEIEKAYDENVRQGGGYIKPTYLTEGQVTLYNKNGPNKEQILYEQLMLLGVNDIQAKAHIQTLRDNDMIKVIEYGTDPTEIVNKIKDTCKEAKELVEERHVNVFKNQILAYIMKFGSKEVANILHAITEYPTVDKTKYSNEIDYYVNHIMHDQDIKLQEYPEQVKLLVDKVFEKYSILCMDMIYKFSEPPKLFGDQEYLLKPMQELERNPKQDKKLKINQDKDDKDILFQCPITLERMKDPVVVAPCGHTFEKDAIKMIFDSGKPCPLCNTPMQLLANNYGLKALLEYQV